MDNLYERNLHLPIGMIGETKRKEAYMERFKHKDPFSEHPAYHYGSHYSSPAIVFHFLLRLRPYDKGAKGIQNGEWDLPDRLFCSMEHLFRNIKEEMSDVREFVPEAYYLP